VSKRSLEDAIEAAGGAVNLLRNSQLGAYVYPVRAEYSNWRDEQRAWRETCVLFDQSHHMTDMDVVGPDTLKLLERLGTNSFANFDGSRAKQFSPCNPDGYVIGDVILFYLEKDRATLVGRPSVMNWVQYNCETGGYSATLERDDRTADRKGPPVRKRYRYQIQGPTAMKVLEKLNGGPLPPSKFFGIGEMTIAGRKVKTLRHGMAGEPGLEIWGPFAEGEEIRSVIVEAGREFGLKQCGARAYSTNALESGWIPSPLPAVYSGDSMKAYRQWLSDESYEATASLGGSFYSDRIEDYYLSPYDLGYGQNVKFDHDFIGRAALEKIAAGNQRRKKVTLAWDGSAIARVIESLFQNDGLPGKFIEWPSAVYATLPYDRIVKNGKTVGISTFAGYTANERLILSLAMIDVEHSEPGTEVMLVWGEEGGGSAKPNVERHAQMEIRATVGPNPFATNARVAYRK
jgi:glycine cleavage system aminomethyltransferase T